MMEGNNGIACLENASTSKGKPPNPYNPSYRQQNLTSDGVLRPCKKSLVRHSSFVKSKTLVFYVKNEHAVENHGAEFSPIVHSGAWANIGFQTSMEDVYWCFGDFMHDFGFKNFADEPNAFYGVFDRHGGKHAADFACYHLPRFTVEDEDFPGEIERVVVSAFDVAFAEACALDSALAFDTTALAALVLGKLESSTNRKYLFEICSYLS